MAASGINMRAANISSGLKQIRNFGLIRSTATLNAINEIMLNSGIEDGVF